MRSLTYVRDCLSHSKLLIEVCGALCLFPLLSFEHLPQRKCKLVDFIHECCEPETLDGGGGVGGVRVCVRVRVSRF